MKKNRTQIGLSERQIEMVEMLKDQLGVTTLSGILGLALIELFNSQFPAHRGFGVTPKNKEKMKATSKQNEQERMYNEGCKVCTELYHGEVGDDGQCHYTTYGLDPKQDTQEEIDVISCTERMCETHVFFPDKETVLKARPALKKIFK